MNNYELASDEYCYIYFKYKTKKMTWKQFKKICGKKKNGWITGQMLCERQNIVLTDFRTRRERFNYLFDKAIQKIKKGIKSPGKSRKKIDYTKTFFGSGKKEKMFDIFPKKNYDFKKLDKDLLGKKRRLFKV